MAYSPVKGLYETFVCQDQLQHIFLFQCSNRTALEQLLCHGIQVLIFQDRLFTSQFIDPVHTYDYRRVIFLTLS